MDDVLAKMLFAVKYPDLLKRLVAVLLGIRYESIENFEIRNPEIPPEEIGSKFCRLDIIMKVDGRLTDLEIQVKKEHDFAERSLYYWARDYSTALGEGGEYAELPQVIIISIVNFKLFDCAEFYSEYQALEVTRHTPLTDRMSLRYFELPKLPELVNADDKLLVWLKLFDAKTEEDLTKLEALEVSDMQQAIKAYRHVSATEEFRALERMRSDRQHNEASALGHARREGEQAEREKWQGVVADKDTTIADQAARIAELEARLGDGK
jgi:predicted transposase/invertase (TIGR01784 family)